MIDMYFEKENVWLNVNLWKPEVFCSMSIFYVQNTMFFFNWYILRRSFFLKVIRKWVFFYLPRFFELFFLNLISKLRKKLKRRNVSGVECSCWMKGKKEDLLLKWLTSWRKWFSRVLIWSWFTRRFQLPSYYFTK